MTITPEKVVNYTSEIEEKADEQNEQTNNKNKVNQHLINNQNVTKRKNRQQKNQNNKNKQLYWINNLPPQLSQENYTPLTTNKNQKDSQTFNHHKIKQWSKKLLFPNSQRTKKTTLIS